MVIFIVLKISAMRILYTLLTCLFIFSNPLLAQPFNFDAISSGATGAFSNGWVGSPTTNFHWQANSGLTTSSTTGPSNDHTLGTSSGIYIYTEASVPAAPGDTAMLTSPYIDISSTAYPGIKFWYHRYGSSMSPCYIDIHHNGTWYLAVDSLVGQQHFAETDPWSSKTIPMITYSDSVQIRFRCIRGANWDSDMAIDDVDLITMPAYDAELHSVTPSHPYVMLPLEQLQPISFSGNVIGAGADTITGVTLTAEINGALNLTGSVPQITPMSMANIVTTSYTPVGVGAYFIDLYTGMNEVDANTLNDSDSYYFETTDTVLARENDGVTQGIGFTNGTGIFGQMFELINPDSLTSVSFKLTAPTQGDFYKMKVYHWDSVAGEPGAIIDSSDLLTIDTNINTWYTREFSCDRILAAGKYFFAVEQVGMNNISFGYTGEYYEQGTTFFNSGTGWTSFESVGFEVTLAIRPNFGPASWPTVDLGPDLSVCNGSTVNINAGVGFSNYTWSDSSTSNSITVGGNDTVWVTVYNSSGCAARDTLIVTLDSLPDVWIPQSAGICDNNPITLVAHNNPNYTYLWHDGTTDSTLQVSTSGTVNVTVTDATGCSNTGFSFVNNSTTPIADITNGDTIVYCEGVGETAQAAGSGNLYEWSNGATGSSITVSQPGWLVVTVTSPFGCAAMDSVWVIENPSPNLILSDTAVEFCDNEFSVLSVNSVPGATYAWSNGATSSSTTIQTTGVYYITITLGNCLATDSVIATALLSPEVDLGADTTICHNVPLDLAAGNWNSVQWSTGDSTSSITVDTEDTYWVVVSESNGCSDVDSINVTVDICGNVGEISNSPVSVYPNPASDFINLEVPSQYINADWKLVSANGAIVRKGIITNTTFKVVLEGLPTGNYFMEVIKDNTIQESVPIIKK